MASPGSVAGRPDGRQYDTVASSSDAWGSAVYGTQSLYGDVTPHELAHHTFSEDQLKEVEALFKELAGARTYLPHVAMQDALHHLQEQRPSGAYVYMYSEKQALAMMPSMDVAPEGLDRKQFLNILFHIHQDLGWPVERLVGSLRSSEGHYGVHPGQRDEKAKSKSGCIVA